MDHGLKVGDKVSFVMYEDRAFSATMYGEVTGLPTSETMQGTVKIKVTKTESKDPFYRKMIGKSLRRHVQGVTKL